MIKDVTPIPPTTAAVPRKLVASNQKEREVTSNMAKEYAARFAKRCKALGISPAVMGYAKKQTNRNPEGQMRKGRRANMASS